MSEVEKRHGNRRATVVDLEPTQTDYEEAPTEQEQEQEATDTAASFHEGLINDDIQEVDDFVQGQFDAHVRWRPYEAIGSLMVLGAGWGVFFSAVMESTGWVAFTSMACLFIAPYMAYRVLASTYTMHGLRSFHDDVGTPQAMRAAYLHALLVIVLNPALILFLLALGTTLMGGMNWFPDHWSVVR